jgi:hypothetical protein
MMDKSTIAALIPDLVSPDDTVRQSALRALYAGDEAAAVILCDLVAAGLNEAQTCAVLEVVGEIGGFDAIMLLLDVFYFEPRPRVKKAAAHALKRNNANLNAQERADVEEFLEDQS